MVLHNCAIKWKEKRKMLSVQEWNKVHYSPNGPIISHRSSPIQRLKQLWQDFLTFEKKTAAAVAEKAKISDSRVRLRYRENKMPAPPLFWCEKSFMPIPAIQLASPKWGQFRTFTHSSATHIYAKLTLESFPLPPSPQPPGKNKPPHLPHTARVP